MRYFVVPVMMLVAALLLALPASAAEMEPFEPEIALTFNLKEDGATLSPQNKLPDELEAHSTGQADFDQYPFFRSNRQATKVGEWATEGVVYDQSISIDQANIWWEGKDPDYEADCEWTFYFKVNDESIEDTVTGCQSNGDELVEETYGIGFVYDLVEGDIFSFEIWYEGWEDVDIYHDNATYDTGFFVTSTPLAFYDARASGSVVAIEFTEAWPVDWKNNLRGGYVMLMGADMWMANNDYASISEGSERETANGTIVTGTVITWEQVTGKELNVLLHYTQFDHTGMGGGGNGTNGSANDPLITLTIVSASILGGDDDGFLGLPGFPLFLAVPALAWAARRR